MSRRDHIETTGRARRVTEAGMVAIASSRMYVQLWKARQAGSAMEE